LRRVRKDAHTCSDLQVRTGIAGIRDVRGRHIFSGLCYNGASNLRDLTTIVANCRTPRLFVRQTGLPAFRTRVNGLCDEVTEAVKATPRTALFRRIARNLSCPSSGFLRLLAV
jgi:hypothetical protein